VYTGADSKTASVQQCEACGKPLLETDRFCRICGVRQSNPADVTGTTASTSPQQYLTSSLCLSESGTAMRRTVSGPLVSAVIGSVGYRGSVMRAAVIALISIPLWLMIVLLSPLDAFAAARALSRQNLDVTEG